MLTAPGTGMEGESGPSSSGSAPGAVGRLRRCPAGWEKGVGGSLSPPRYWRGVLPVSSSQKGFLCTDTDFRENKGIGKPGLEILMENRCCCNHGGLVCVWEPGSCGVVLPQCNRNDLRDDCLRIFD